nr:histidine kinase [uncultured Draconibacterium sp.]
METIRKQNTILLKVLFYLVAGSFLYITINFIFQIYYDYPKEYSLSQHIGTIVLTAILTEGLIFINSYLKNRENFSQSNLQRILVLVSVDIIFVITLVSASGIFLMLTFASDDRVIITFFDLLTTNLVAICYSFIIVLAVSLYETNRNLRISLIKMERFKKENAEAKFHSLKKQLSPHFLFNTLNTLYNIIDKDKELAKDYLLKIADIYRYVLENENNELIELKKELDFAHDYAFLIGKRFGDAFEFNVNVPEKLMNKHIPPLTMQILTENVLKHNKLDLANKLILSVYVANNNELVIKNNITAKNVQKNTTGLGLQNLNNRYRYLVNNEITITNTETEFVVKIPLIDVENYESINHRR